MGGKKQASATQEEPSEIDTFYCLHTVNGDFPSSKGARGVVSRHTTAEINAMVRGGKLRGHIPGVGLVLPGYVRSRLSYSAPVDRRNDVDFMVSLMRSDDRFADAFARYDSGRGAREWGQHIKKICRLFPSDMSLGKGDSKRQNSRLGKRCKSSNSSYPSECRGGVRHVAGDTFPQRHVAGEGVRKLLGKGLITVVFRVSRSKNKKADALSKIASTSFVHLSKQVLVEELKEKSVNESEVLAVVEEEGESWMTPIHEYLTDETLPAKRKKARSIKRKSQRFAIINRILYKKSFLGPWLRCVGPSQANYVLREIHEGSCSMHAGTRFVVAKALRIGYYWPTMHKDARALIKACQECQVHKPVPRNPQEKLNPITSPWPFYKWGIDIAGPFPKRPGKVKFLIVVMNYFTKWIEAKPVATITRNQVKKFVWENIVCRFGLPREIISDNGKQFRDNPFKDWCEKLCIQQHFTFVKHPQTNGLVKRANRSLGEGIKVRLGKNNKNWMEEISHVLWVRRTMVKSSNGDTPFSLTYGTEAVILAEIGMPTFRTVELDMAKNDEALQINLELLEEKREQAAITEAKSKRQMEKYYNAKF
ncbi:reverse transcriptase domain-containing protein [Tanacetum coccineum]